MLTTTYQGKDNKYTRKWLYLTSVPLPFPQRTLDRRINHFAQYLKDVPLRIIWPEMNREHVLLPLCTALANLFVNFYFRFVFDGFTRFYAVKIIENIDTQSSSWSEKAFGLVSQQTWFCLGLSKSRYLIAVLWVTGKAGTYRQKSARIRYWLFCQSTRTWSNGTRNLRRYGCYLEHWRFLGYPL